jgi:type IV pilus assembly protein PilA
VALPAYQDYTKRAKMSEVILAASACRTTITEVYQSGSQTTVAANAWGCEATSTAPSKYVASITTDGNGVITVTAAGFNDTDIDNKSITLTPSTTAGAALTYSGTAATIGRWICGPSAANGILPKFLPGSCRGS